MRSSDWSSDVCSSDLAAGGATLGTLNAVRPLQPLPGPRWAMADPAAMQAGADWPAYGGTYSARRYSPLTQITPANVGKLERAWTIHTGDLPSEAAHGTYRSDEHTSDLQSLMRISYA